MEEDISASPDTPAAEAPSKVCRGCSVLTRTDGAFCPQCGKPYTRVGRKPKHKLTFIATTVAIVLALGAGTAFFIAKDNEVRAQEQSVANELAEQKALELEPEQLGEAEREKRRNDSLRKLRKQTVILMEKDITQSAQSKVADGLIQGPISETQCTILSGGSHSDLDAKSATFQCLAMVEGVQGAYGYTATMNWDANTYSWQLD